MPDQQRTAECKCGEDPTDGQYADLIATILLITAGVFLVGGVIVLSTIAYVHVTETSVKTKFLADVFPNLLILVAIIFQAYVYVRQWQSMNKSAGIANRSLVASQQSYVGIQNIKWNNPQFRGDTPAGAITNEGNITPDTIVIDVGNSGNVPADSIKVEIKTIVYVPEEFVPSVAPQSDWLRDFEHSCGSAKLFKGNLPIQIPLKLTRYPEITTGVMRLIMDEKAFIAVCGSIQYRDDFSSGFKTTEFRLNYMGNDVWAHAAPELWIFHVKGEPKAKST